MATKTFLKNIDLKKKVKIRRFTYAAEKAIRNAKEVEEVHPVKVVKKSDLKKYF